MLFTNIRLNFKIGFIVTFLLFLESCSKYSYTVYNENFNKVKINLMDTNQVVILKDYVSCIGCIETISNYYKDKRVIIISSVHKSKAAIITERNSLLNQSPNFSQILFVFYRKGKEYDLQEYNKLFKSYGEEKSPTVIVTDSILNIKTYSFPEFSNLIGKN